MLVALVINYLASQGAQAAPVAALAQAPPPIIGPFRTKYDIISSCLITIFTCTWVAIHPNILEPGIGYKKKFLYRVRLMILTLIAPECTIAWAMRQWLSARRLGQKYKSESAFANMFEITQCCSERLDTDPRVLCHNGRVHALRGS